MLLDPKTLKTSTRVVSTEKNVIDSLESDCHEICQTKASQVKDIPEI